MKKAWKYLGGVIATILIIAFLAYIFIPVLSKLVTIAIVIVVIAIVVLVAKNKFGN